ncbi:serine/threonine-protein kinase [Streptomyces cavernae]|uniref:serine/threonine-protein kinase n=1 Tax=Streptomyces cavernae TaxID=2259034 RepID=UPI001EE44FF8|nr:serine/threonine-protein kinase [Streptomyces cavernae]
MIGTRVGDYVIERELGTGGMGSVYLARSPSGRAVAVKVIHAGLADQPQFRERFRHEVEAARKVGGFHTAAVVAADPYAEFPWMASAYVKGPTLSEEVSENGPLNEKRLWTLAAELAEALEAIHSCGLVHRDFKPSNIVLTDDGARVLDFGIARAAEGIQLTATGVALGTPGFLAPEQALGEPVTGASDVFALGAVLVSAAGGEAFGGETPSLGAIFRAVYGEPDLSAVPEALRELVLACLHKEPAMRPTPRQVLHWCANRPGLTPDDPRTPWPSVADHTPATPASDVAFAAPPATPAPHAAFPAPHAAFPAPPSTPAPHAASATPHPASATPHPASATPHPAFAAPPAASTPAPHAASAAPPDALYQHSRRDWARFIGRQMLIAFGLVVASAVNFYSQLSLPLMVLTVVATFVVTGRLIGLLVSGHHGVVLNDAGIGVGSPKWPIVLRWADTKSLELDTNAKGIRLTVRLRGGHLPHGFLRPAWLRTSRKKGIARVRTELLTPVGDAPALPDAVRAFAARHGVPLTENRLN